MQRSWLCVLVIVAACATKTAPPVAPTAPDPRIALAAQRALQIEHLHDYWVSGEFPTDLAQRPVSVFRDAAGRECAMAALIAQSGREDLVAEVTRKNNSLRLADVHDGPLIEWILGSGLTKDEAVMIQGALELDYNQLQRQIPEDSMVTAAARHEVRNRLRKAEAELRANTHKSLALAANARRVGAASGTIAAWMRTTGTSR